MVETTTALTYYALLAYLLRTYYARTYYARTYYVQASSCPASKLPRSAARAPRSDRVVTAYLPRSYRVVTAYLPRTYRVVNFPVDHGRSSVRQGVHLYTPYTRDTYMPYAHSSVSPQDPVLLPCNFIDSLNAPPFLSGRAMTAPQT